MKNPFFLRMPRPFLTATSHQFLPSENRFRFRIRRHENLTLDCQKSEVSTARHPQSDQVPGAARAPSLWQSAPVTSHGPPGPRSRVTGRPVAHVRLRRPPAAVTSAGPGPGPAGSESARGAASQIRGTGTQWPRARAGYRRGSPGPRHHDVIPILIYVH
jgi:hypothetical protein